MPRALTPARYPPTGAWPAQMRADMAAAYLDYADTTQLAAAVRRGEAPAPSSMRGSGRRREPIWARADLDRVASRFHRSESTPSSAITENLAALV